MFEDYQYYGKKDCFAYQRGGYCIALDVMRCEGCSFYKTVEEHNEQLKRLERIQTTSEYKKAVAQLKAKQEAAAAARPITTTWQPAKTGDGYKLYRLRKSKGMSQIEFAALLGWYPHNISYFENKARFSRRKRNEICAKLHLPNGYFEGV